jgi:excisionase family DNA binding protein
MGQISELTVQQTALRLGVTLKYVRDLLYEGRFTGAKKVGRQWLIPAATVEARVRARQLSQSQQPEQIP